GGFDGANPQSGRVSLRGTIGFSRACAPSSWNYGRSCTRGCSLRSRERSSRARVVPDGGRSRRTTRFRRLHSRHIPRVTGSGPHLPPRPGSRRGSLCLRAPVWREPRGGLGDGWFVSARSQLPVGSRYATISSPLRTSSVFPTSTGWFQVFALSDGIFASSVYL